MKKLIWGLCLLASSWATNINEFASATAITVNNSTATNITTGLKNTTTIQMFIRSTSTAQAFTFSFPNGNAVEVPSGATLTLRIGGNLAAGDAIGSVITASSSAVMQLMFFREVKQ